jgi:two-component system NarL family sensor kinase
MESSQELILLTLIVGILVMLALSGGVVYFVIQYQRNAKKFQKDIFDATIQASDNEREIVAKNIHDDLGALTNIIKMNNIDLKNKLDNKVAIINLIEANDKLLSDIVTSIRAISSDLASPTLMKFGLMSALGQLVSQFPSFVKTNFVCDDEDIRFDRKVEMQLFRIVKEVLTNILKHSNCTEIDINVTFTANALDIAVKYNGKGINDEDVKLLMKDNKGLGLKSVLSRVQLLDGTIRYLREENGYFKCAISVPVKTESHA